MKRVHFNNNVKVYSTFSKYEYNRTYHSSSLTSQDYIDLILFKATEMNEAVKNAETNRKMCKLVRH